MVDFFVKLKNWIIGLYTNPISIICFLVSWMVWLVSIIARGIASVIVNFTLPVLPKFFDDFLPGDVLHFVEWAIQGLSLDYALSEMLTYWAVYWAVSASHVGALPIKVVKRYVLRDSQQ